MKNKLLKTSLLIGFGSAIGVAIATSVVVTSTSKVEVKNETSTKTKTTVNATGKTKVSFLVKDADKDKVKITGSPIQAGEIGDPFCSIHHPTATFEDRQQNYWIYAEGDNAGKRVKDTDPITANMKVYPFFENQVELRNCLTMVALESTMVTVINHGGNNPDLSYSTDAFSWSPVKSGEVIQIDPNKTLYFKGNNSTGFNKSEEIYTSFSITGTVNLVGNVMTLLDNGKGDRTDIPCDYCFARLFEDATGVRVISSNFLPATGLKPYCYDSMFKGCINLNAFPTYLIEAITLQPYCYKEMFSGCVKLESVSPELLKKAGTLAEGCYAKMFYGCTSLAKLDTGVLPTVTLAKSCFAGMFGNCSGLTEINSSLLSKDTLAESCYWGMFSGCTGLTDLSGFSLPATDLTGGDYCYYDMFYNCSGITKAPNLPATTLSKECYYCMFGNCKNLTTSPTLAATSIAEGAYQSMFQGSGLTTIPALPAGTGGTGSLAKSCYKDMFRNCKSLGNLSDKSLPAQTLAANCYETMFYNSSLTGAPSISATNLADSCCFKMFYKCANLTASPALLATTAAPTCYREMFGYCTSLTSIGKISLTQLADFACRQMFDNCEKVKISSEVETTASNFFFTCPEFADYEDAVDNMFQNTKGKEETGYTPTEGANYGYSS